MRKVLKNKSGMTLVECLVAGVLIGVASLVIFGGFRAMMRLTDESTRLKQDQSALTQSVAAAVPEALENGVISTPGNEGKLDLNGAKIDIQFYTYTTENGQSFDVFKRAD